MGRKETIFFTAAILLGTELAAACQGPFPVIAVQHSVTEQAPERVEATTTNPLERLLAKAPRLAALRSLTGHGSVALEMRFEGGATEQDLAMVKRQIEDWTVRAETGVISTKVFLTSSCLRTWPWLDAERLSPGD